MANPPIIHIAPAAHYIEKKGNVSIMKTGPWTRRYKNDFEYDYPNGKPACQHDDGSFEHRKKGILTRNPSKGPAAIYYNKHGVPIFVEYRWKGRLHRLDGPALVSDQQDDIYAFWGYNVPKEWTENLTREMVKKHPNKETRQAGYRALKAKKALQNA